jgi:hypothetical protein
MGFENHQNSIMAIVNSSAQQVELSFSLFVAFALT